MRKGSSATILRIMKRATQFATGEFAKAAKAIKRLYELIKEFDERTMEMLLALIGRLK